MRAILVFLFALTACSPSGPKFPDTFHPPFPAPEIALKGANGAYTFPADLAKNKQAVTLVFFGFTHCPDICPTTLLRLSKAVSALTPDQQKQIRVLFISIDPERDTPEAAAQYAAGFHSGFTGLSGTRAEIDRVKTAFGAMSTNEGGEISHTSSIYWIDGEGKVRKTIRQNFEAADLTHDLALAAGQKEVR